MFAHSLDIYGFKCFGKAKLELIYPGGGDDTQQFDNINLILGDNGGGKSSVLRAVAIAVLAPVLLESGFVPYRLVRRPDAENSLLKLVGKPQNIDSAGEQDDEAELPLSLEMLARIDRREKGSLDRLHIESTPNTPVERLIYDDESPAFFVVGYGATRRVETGDFVESSYRRSRGLRYQRVAGLFEDHVPLRPLAAWFRKLNERRMKEVVELFNQVLPDTVRFHGDKDEDGEYLFSFEGKETPFAALSDGYKAFIGWVSDLIGHLNDVCPKHSKLTDVSGIALVDEIDLHLHPAWQRQVVQLLSSGFPRLQFIMTTHSPLIASSVHKENIFLTEKANDGTATIGKTEETTYGRSIEHLLMSSYFGLESTRPDMFQSSAQVLFERSAKGDPDAALEFLEQMSKMPDDAEELTEHFKKASAEAEKRAKATKKRRRKR